MSVAIALFVLAAALIAWVLRPCRGSEITGTRFIVADPLLLAARQQRLASEQVRLEADLDLLRGVFEVSAELVGCVDETDLRSRLSSALSRYWIGASLELLVWERGAWRWLGCTADGAVPELGAPVVLPEESGGALVLDLSPGVDGQAALVLRGAREQPSLASLGANQRRGVAELLRGQFALSLRRVMLFRSLQDLARCDPLTGAWRRWYGEARLGELTEAGAVVAICIADIDHFKRVNDGHGHGGGDRVLAAVSKTLIAGVRAEDLVARIGGEEFLIVLTTTPLAGATMVAERLRAAVSSLADLPVAVTISLGVACCRRDESAGELVARADAALYRAKEQGRNRVVSADGPEDRDLVRVEPARRGSGSASGSASASGSSISRVQRPPSLPKQGA